MMIITLYFSDQMAVVLVILIACVSGKYLKEKSVTYAFAECV